MDNKGFIELLEQEDVQTDIINMYCKLHRELWSNYGTKYHIVLDQTGGVYDMVVTNFDTINEDILEGRAIIVTSIDGEFIEVTSDDMGDVRDVENFDDFKEWVLQGILDQYGKNCDDIEQYLDEDINWNVYFEFDPTNYNELETDAWYSKCDYYDYDYIKDKIQQRIDCLEETITF